MPSIGHRSDGSGDSAGPGPVITLGSLCVTLAELWQPDRDGLQGVFLQPIARLLAKKTTQQTARARLITDRRKLCRGSLEDKFPPANLRTKRVACDQAASCPPQRVCCHGLRDSRQKAAVRPMLLSIRARAASLSAIVVPFVVPVRAVVAALIGLRWTRRHRLRRRNLRRWCGLGRGRLTGLLLLPLGLLLGLLLSLMRALLVLPVLPVLVGLTSGLLLLLLLLLLDSLDLLCLLSLPGQLLLLFLLTLHRLLVWQGSLGWPLESRGWARRRLRVTRRVASAFVVARRALRRGSALKPAHTVGLPTLTALLRGCFDPRGRLRSRSRLLHLSLIHI